MEEYINRTRKDYPKLTEIFRFLVVGTLATLIDMLVMAVIIYKFDSIYASFFDVFLTTSTTSSLLVVVATAIGFIVGLIVNYILSLLYVYQGENTFAKTKKGFLMFAILSTIGLLIQTAGMYIGYSLLHFNEWIIKIFLVVVVLIFNYITRKIFVFKSISTIKTKSKIQIDKKSVILNIIFSISSVCLMLILYRSVKSEYDIYLKILYILATFAICFLCLTFVIKHALQKIDFKNKKLIIISIIIAILFSVTITIYSIQQEKYTTESFIKYSILIVFAFYSIFVYSYLLVKTLNKRIKLFWQNLNTTEQRIFVTIVGFGIIISLVLSVFTHAFNSPNKYYDTIFSFDTGSFSKHRLNIFAGENDIRHFLLTLSMYPFLIIPNTFALILNYELIYGLCYVVIQVVLIAYCVIELIKLLNITDNKNKIFACIALCCSAGIFFNMIIVEKFVISTFYIISTIKLTKENSNLKWITLLGAVGMLTTSIVLLPIVLFYNKRPLKEIVSNSITFCLMFGAVLIITGQLNLLFSHSYEVIFSFSSLKSNLTFSDKLIQTLIFVSNVILCPTIAFRGDLTIQQSSAKFGVFAVIGIVILVVLVISSIINRKNKFARVCTYWNICTIIFLLIFGWGSVLNEMFIYSLIFGWSIIALLIMLFKEIKINIKLKQTIVICLLCAIICWNLFSLIKITYYASIFNL